VNRRGFTLLEIIVAVGLVATLLALLLPALVHARELSQKALCAANTRSIGLAFQMYLGDHRRFPPSVVGSAWRYGGVDFVGPERTPVMTASRPINTALADRLPSTETALLQTFRCPSDRGIWRNDLSEEHGQSVLDGNSCYTSFGTSYRANPALFDSTLAGLDGLQRPLAEHEITVGFSRLLIAGDAVWHYATRQSPDPDARLDASWHRTPRAGNMVAMDGSVRFETFSATPATFTLSPLRDNAR
jgi:prepilin-type N-terminal cleavage/methylation domain-containing protein